MGNFHHISNVGIGGTAKYAFAIDKTYGLTLEAGTIRYNTKAQTLLYYNNSSSESLYEPGYAFTAIPVKIGGRFKYKQVFAEPQIGLTYFSNQDTFQNASTTYGINTGGYLTRNLTLEGSFERWNRGGFSASHVGIRLAYNFRLAE
ncbi:MULTISPECIES: hypothetical protein [Chitinophagaceae]